MVQRGGAECSLCIRNGDWGSDSVGGAGRIGERNAECRLMLTSLDALCAAAAGDRSEPDAASRRPARRRLARRSGVTRNAGGAVAASLAIGPELGALNSRAQRPSSAH